KPSAKIAGVRKVEAIMNWSRQPGVEGLLDPLSLVGRLLQWEFKRRIDVELRQCANVLAVAGKERPKASTHIVCIDSNGVRRGKAERVELIESDRERAADAVIDNAEPAAQGALVFAQEMAQILVP